MLHILKTAIIRNLTRFSIYELKEYYFILFTSTITS